VRTNEPGSAGNQTFHSILPKTHLEQLISTEAKLIARFSLFQRASSPLKKLSMDKRSSTPEKAYETSAAVKSKHTFGHHD
jgi:hypothetical protein